MGKIVYYALVLSGCNWRSECSARTRSASSPPGLSRSYPKLFVALIIVVVASALAAAVRDLLSDTLSGLSYGKLLVNLASILSSVWASSLP